ncbi:uncharacterized protein LOC111633740 [Centruroides sculpturatus]|uniref:uncharacterized protein LOC111633740 n=1 Tax=Centruroides sculpturatus TaxID=218467 RepID=UPI000C6EE68B|nr:uncharacterized protein LOC111633740 [Centruroides sculpturatus]
MISHTTCYFFFLFCTLPFISCVKVNDDVTLHQSVEKYRQNSVSKVFTVNLSNAIFMIVAKVVLIGAIYYYIFNKDSDYDDQKRQERSISASKPDINDFLNYFLAINTDNHECVYKFACENPEKAKVYINRSLEILEIFESLKKSLLLESISKKINTIKRITEENNNCKKFICKRTICHMNCN